jgi:hypothetical protein
MLIYSKKIQREIFFGKESEESFEMSFLILLPQANG